MQTLEALQSPLNPKLRFIIDVDGTGSPSQRLISCTDCCGGWTGSGLHVKWMNLSGVETSLFTGMVPACMAGDAPHQGEYATHTVADEVAEMESPHLYGKRPPPRACVEIAQRVGSILVELPDLV